MELREKIKSEVLSARILAKTVDEAVDEILLLFSVKNEVAVCEDPFCVNGEIQYQSGEFVNCDKCNKKNGL